MMNFFKILLLSILFFVTTNVKPQGYWNKISSPTSQLLRHLFFINSTDGWAIGRDGLIIRTTDGGDTWTEQNSTVQTFIVSIFFLNENLGWALSIKDTQPFGTIILSTTNGGEVWTAEDYPEINEFMNTVFFLDPLNGFLGGSKIVKTTNGGLNWMDVNVDSNMISTLPVYRFKFFSPQFGYACGGFIDFAGVIWRTTDYGYNWTATDVSPDQVFDIFIIDSLNAVTLSGDPEGFYGVGKINTTDAGETWSYEQLPIFALSFSIDFRTLTDGWSASGYKLLFTSDRGNTWSETNTPNNIIIYDLTFTNSRTGYAVGDDGVILKYSLDSTDVNDVFNSEYPSNFFLDQNYPNPFNPNTKIKYKIGSACFVTLTVYDPLGNEVATLVDEELPSGVYEAEFNAAKLTSGIYFYKLRAGNYTGTKKMVLLK